MTADSLRPLLVSLVDPFVRMFYSFKVSPNTLTLISLLFAALAGLSFYMSGDDRLILGIALVFVLLNAFMDGVDGALARKSGTSSKYGDFLDHVVDRYADVFIICGIFFGGYLPVTIGVMVIVGVLLASYLGTQGQAVGVGRVYGGIMGRADRMIVILLATSLNLLYPGEIGIQGFGFTVLGWALIIIGVTSHITALQRIWHIRKSLIEDTPGK